MKKLTALILSLVLMTAAFTGCASSKPEPTPSPTPELTPSERAELYKNAIESARSEEDNQYNPIMTDTGFTDAELILELMGLTPEDMEAFAISISLMNVRAYGVAVIKPAEGQEEIVYAAMQSFIDLQKQNFEQYLADQYEIASSARLETLEDGTVIMVMCQGADEVLSAIESSITGQAA